jgi:serine/threonine-protein kinase
LVEHTRGHAREAQAALDEVVRQAQHGAAFQIAEIHAWRGDSDRAFEWLDRAYAQRDAGVSFTKQSILFKSLRKDPRYAAFLKKLGLPQ